MCNLKFQGLYITMHKYKLKESIVLKNAFCTLCGYNYQILQVTAVVFWRYFLKQNRALHCIQIPKDNIFCICVICAQCFKNKSIGFPLKHLPHCVSVCFKVCIICKPSSTQILPEVIRKQNKSSPKTKSDRLVQLKTFFFFKATSLCHKKCYPGHQL